MSEPHRTDLSPSAEKRIHAALPDAELVERIRVGATTACPAAHELRRRHLPSVLSYARLCGRNQVAGNHLATQALALATQEVRRGIGPHGPWRHHLLMLVQRAAATWIASGRRSRLDPEFAAWLDDTGATAADRLGERPPPFAQRSAMLGGFCTLPERLCGILWYGVVDDEPDDRVAGFVGPGTDPVAELKTKALDAMRQACLRTHLQRAGDKSCQGYRRLIEVAVRPGDHRRTGDLDQHLAACPRCDHVVTELTRMVGNPRAVLAEGLLGWGGEAYVAAGPVLGLDAVETAVERARQERPAPAPMYSPLLPPEPRSRGREGRRTRRASRPHLVAAVAAATAAGLALALLTAHTGGTRPVGSSVETLAEPTVTVTQTATETSLAPSVTVTATAGPSKVSRPSARRTHKPRAPKPTRARGTVRPPTLPGDGYTLVANADSGLCLDIANGYLDNGTDVVTAPCTGTATQLWRLDSRGLMHTRADSGFCLDSRGNTYRGAGIWTCSAVDGYHGENLLFTVDRRGVIRPRIAPDFALTPDGDHPGSLLAFRPAYDRSDQRWTTRP